MSNRRNPNNRKKMNGKTIAVIVASVLAGEYTFTTGKNGESDDTHQTTYL